MSSATRRCRTGPVRCCCAGACRPATAAAPAAASRRTARRDHRRSRRRVIDSALIAPFEPAAPVIGDGFAGVDAFDVGFHGLRHGRAGEVVTLTVLPSALVTYSVLPDRYATVPVVAPGAPRRRSARRGRPPPRRRSMARAGAGARRAGAPLVPAPAAPRSAAKREARPRRAACRAELEEVWPFSTSTPPMNPQAISSTPSSASAIGFPPAPQQAPTRPGAADRSARPTRSRHRDRLGRGLRGLLDDRLLVGHGRLLVGCVATQSAALRSVVGARRARRGRYRRTGRTAPPRRRRGRSSRWRFPGAHRRFRTGCRSRRRARR